MEQLSRYAFVKFKGSHLKSTIQIQDHPGGEMTLLATVGAEVPKIEIEDMDSFPEAVYELITDLLGRLEK